MRVLKAHVRGGRLVIDEPTTLPEGTELQAVPVDEYGMSSEERDALEASLEESEADAAAGRGMTEEEVWASFRTDR